MSQIGEALDELEQPAPRKVGLTSQEMAEAERRFQGIRRHYDGDDDYDPLDDMSDLQPYERTTRYPWGY